MVSAIREEFTANDSSIGNSGGITEVKINTHSKNSLYLFLLGSSEPFIQTYDAAATANTSKNKMNPKVSLLFAVTRFTPNSIVLNNFPCDVLKPVLNT